MTYQALKYFILNQMRMSHIYQPVMIKKLLASNGSATDREIATILLQYDPSQLEYYQSITNKMVGKVLRSHKIVDKTGPIYSLNEFASLTNNEVQELIKICDKKVDDYINKRGDAIWNHRRVNRNTISGSIRYEVLKRAKFRCELCGISYDERALEVDHIEPVNTGGEDSINNYQALCFICNANKRDKDNTDFRDKGMMYSHRQAGCLFCSVQKNRIVSENNLAYIIYDQFPVTQGHCLIIPKRHFPDYFGITQAESNSILTLINQAKVLNLKKDKNITGFNIGLNCGESAGQTILHTHIHLIPRRENDVDFPRGGIRNIIPGKGSY